MNTLKTIISEHTSFKKQIIKLAKSDIIKTYRGSAFGWSWALVKPAITIFVFWFAFCYGLRMGGDIDGFPFFLWLIAGYIPWTYMSDMITGGAGCIRRYTHLVTKMKFPISVIPTFFSLSKMMVHLILLVIVIAIYVVFGHLPTIYYLQLPLYILMMYAWFTVWGLFAGLLSCISLDFQNVVKSFSTAIFWFSGIMYDVNSIGIPWIKAILSFNPVTIIANGYRNVFVYQTWFFETPIEMRNYIILLVVIILASLWAYKKTHKDIADVL